jgi:hypothetical protein
MSRTRGNADRVNLHRVREAQVGMAIADRKEERRTAEQFDCGGIFSCNSDSSKSTEASGNSLAMAGSLSAILPKFADIKVFKIALPDCAQFRGVCV